MERNNSYCKSLDSAVLLVIINYLCGYSTRVDALNIGGAVIALAKIIAGTASEVVSLFCCYGDSHVRGELGYLF